MPNRRKIYVASSWRNERYEEVISDLRAVGHEVYNWRNPAPGKHGFHWSEIDPEYKSWTPEQFRSGLASPKAQEGFGDDYTGMQWADTCVLLLPCGRSAHLEAGWMVAKGNPTIVAMFEPSEPELMYRLTDGIVTNTYELLGALALLG